MSRKTILANIRRSLGSRRASDLNRRASAQSRLDEPFRHVIPLRARPSDPPEQFAAEFERNSGDVLKAESRDLVPKAAALYLEQLKLPLRIRLGEDALLNALPWTGTPGFQTSKGLARPEDMVCVSHAVAGIAETGTLVLASGRDNPASLAFLADVHIVVLARSAITGALEDGFELVRKRYGRNQMPRSLNLISGPSRTGDIGGRIVLGAHGPRRLAVIIYADAASPPPASPAA